MKKNLRVLGHSLHPMLIVFPLGLLGASVVWDLVYLISGEETWGTIAYWTIVAGLVGGAVAAVPGLIDWSRIQRGTRAKRIGLWHMALNLATIGLFVVSLLARAADGYADPSFGEMAWGWLGLGISLVSAWLGGELVERLGVGVDDDADLNAPSSLRHEGRGYGLASRSQQPL